MPHCTLLKAIPPLLLYRWLCLWHLWLASPSFPVVQFSRWLLSNWSLLRAARPKQFSDKVWAGPSVPPSSLFSGLCLDISSFISGGSDPFTTSSHPLIVAESKTQLFTSKSPALWPSWRFCQKFSPSSDSWHLVPRFTMLLLHSSPFCHLFSTIGQNASSLYGQPFGFWGAWVQFEYLIWQVEKF
jgi:hypothetical protein